MIKLATAMLVFILPAMASAASLSDGRSEYDRNHVAEAERIYAAVVADSSASVADRSAAERELARIAWLIDGDPARALSHLEAATKLGDKACDTSELTARVLRESKQLAEALKRGAGLIASCAEPSGVDKIRAHLIGARLDLAATNSPSRAQMLAEAVSESARFSPDADVEAARVRLEAALLTDDAAGALNAWKDYFWLQESDAPQALEKSGATAVFNSGLGNGATAESRLKLAELLMRAGFAEPSRRFAYANGLQRSAARAPTWTRLDAYWRERDKLETRLLKLHREMARGKSDRGGVIAAAKQFMAALAQATGASGDPQALMLEYYGIVGSAGETNGYPSIHAGHVIEDHADQVTQYGQTAKIHFQAIDNMISNGFTTWLWDGSAAVGGWSSNDVIVHIRPAYVQSPLRAFQETQDTDARRRLIERGGKLASEDIAKLKLHPVATLDGLNDRLELQLVDRVAAVAHTKSTDAAGFRRAFLAEFWRASLDQSISKHEGRHAIDHTLGLSDKVDPAVLEYQAKLSELALSDYPRMALRNMDRSLEGDAPHDRAGARIFDDYRKWMEAHTGEIMGYDAAVPALAQLDKLSDGQIREIARTLDPLANGKPSPAKL
jgi:hypothetical protein